MAWFGVPFVSEEEWDGFPWADVAFLNQFTQAAGLRMGTVAQLADGRFASSATGSAYDVVVSDALQYCSRNGEGDRGTFDLNWFRGFFGQWNESAGDLYLPAWPGVRWAVNDLVVAGSPLADAMVVDPATGRITQAFLDRVNAKLGEAGCPPMGDTVLTTTEETLYRGIPWTRKYGSRAAPSEAFGIVRGGDIIGRHFFNEYWAVLECLKTLVLDFSLNTDQIQDSESAFEFGSGTDYADALVDLEAEWTGVGLADGDGYFPSASLNLLVPGSVQGIRRRSRVQFGDLAADHVDGGGKVVWVADANVVDPGVQEFFDHDEDSKVEGSIYLVDSFGGWTGAAGTMQTPIRRILTPAPTTNGAVDCGYNLTPYAVLQCLFPPPA